MKGRTLDADVRRLCLRFMQDLNTPVSLGVYLLIKYGEWDQLACKRIDPQHYLDSQAERFRRDYQAVELLRKYAELPTSVDRRQVAEDGFWAAEALCAETNARLDKFLYLVQLDREDLRIWEFVQDVKRLIKSILGPVPSNVEGRFGPGAVFESQGHPYAKKFVLGDKMSLQPTATTKAWEICLHTVLPTYWGRSIFEGVSTPFVDPPEGSLVRGNRFTTVPKDCTKDRGICVEPGLNVFTQLGVGRHIRNRLKKVGVDIGDYIDESTDLNKGQEKHHRLAALGSVTNDLATIDLSSASDTVAKNLVRLLLPEDWFDLLDSLRSPFTRMKRGKRDTWVRLEKFSSMGNGFTFELETLIFYALSRVACGRRGGIVSVYGDDIIVPTTHARAVVSALQYFGFKTNPRKTYLNGPFRESCGGDYFSGVLVTPYRLKHEPRRPSDWISVANGLWRWSELDRFHRRYPAARARSTALGCVPSDIRSCKGPTRLGDLVIHAPREQWNIKEDQFGMSWIRVWQPVPVKVSLSRFKPPIQLSCALYGAPSSGLSPRNAVSGYRFGEASVS